MTIGFPQGSIASKFTGSNFFYFYDTETAKLANLIAYNLSHKVVTPVSYGHSLGKKHIKYEGFHELSYLHPNVFTPDSSVLEELDLKPEDSFFILRFVSWDAHHDYNLSGISNNKKIKLVKHLVNYGRVFISSETQIPRELEKYKLNLEPARFLDLLSFSRMSISEGATVSTESAILGVPSIYFNPSLLGYVKEIKDNYGLIYHTEDVDEIEDLVDKVCNIPLKEWSKKRQNLLDEKIDVSSFVIDLISK